MCGRADCKAGRVPSFAGSMACPECRPGDRANTLLADVNLLSVAARVAFDLPRPPDPKPFVIPKGDRYVAVMTPPVNLPVSFEPNSIARKLDVETRKFSTRCPACGEFGMGRAYRLAAVVPSSTGEYSMQTLCCGEWRNLERGR